MEYLPIQEYSNIWNISKRRIQVLCKEGRIPEAKMIGNMWVIPKNMSRPIDARVKSPIIENNIEDSVVRKELKKLLKKLYDSCIKNNIEVENYKDYVLSIIAGELCSFYLGEKLDNSLLSMIFNDISAHGKEIKFDLQDLLEVEKFIAKYKTDVEIDNILSWAYQYSNKYIQDNSFSKTQFFTEKYMIKYLVRNIEGLNRAKKILDPCVGGGNFLVECLEELCNRRTDLSVDSIIACCSNLYGYDIDNKITRVAVVNIRLRVFAILKRNKVKFNIDVWNRIKPNIFMSMDGDTIQGSLTKSSKKLLHVISKKTTRADVLFGGADIVLTNPPFSSVKGMCVEQKKFLKKDYPLSNCDTCVAFMEAIGNMLSENGVCGIVSQSAWMYLKSFEMIRSWIVNNYAIERIVNLGSGAFQDLSGEKSNVALIVFSKQLKQNKNVVKILNVNASTYEDKVRSVNGQIAYIEKEQEEINGINGFDFAEVDLLSELRGKTELYKDIAAPMQGTSTGNAKELVGYFWEHFGDSEWISVSNGGGYCRWQGLNYSVVRWGNDGEYIKEQKGSALRNVKFFPETKMVFSDTGTAGLNVRVLHSNQIFIASGPGIRIKKGNEYAHMALLNSRIASYCIRLMSPKLTIAAGYIGQIPVKSEIYSSVVLEKNARLCVELKEKMLSTRTSNIEYSDAYLSKLPSNIEMAAWGLFNEDITNELMKLELEYKIDTCIVEYFGFSDDARATLSENVGRCAYEILGSEEIDLSKLDKYLDKLLDSNCCLKRTKNAKSALGSDGYLEYAAKDLNVNPEIIVKRIQEDPYKLERVLKRYTSLLLHNYVLFCMGYNTEMGVSQKSKKLDDLLCEFNEAFEEYEFSNWVMKYFNDTHTEIFKGRPYLVYDKGEIRIR